MTIKIITDSTCDLPQEIIQELDIRVIPLYINIGEKGYLDTVEITRMDFYNNLPNYDTHPKTGTPGVDMFTRSYRALQANGASEVLSIHISKSLSATVDIARQAAKEISAIPVTVRDSGQLSIGTGFQVELAARLAKLGKNMTEILSALDNLAKRTFVAARLNTLDYLRRSGRMNAVMTGIASFLKIIPILTMANGMPGSERVRTRQRAEERLIKLIQLRQPIEKFALLHTNALEEAQAFYQKIAHIVPETTFHTMDITPVIGAHIGPGAVGYAIVSK